jgi:hypothetical protein
MNVIVQEFQLHIVDQTGGHFRLSRDDVKTLDIELSNSRREESPYNPMVKPSCFAIEDQEYVITIRLERMPIMTYPQLGGDSGQSQETSEGTVL